MPWGNQNSTLSFSLPRPTTTAELHRAITNTAPDSNECWCTIALTQGSCHVYYMYDTFNAISLRSVFRNTTESARKDLQPTNIISLFRQRMLQRCPVTC